MVILVLFGLAGQANAGLVELVDSNEAALGSGVQANNLTLHVETGFYWLDIDVHAGKSRDTVTADVLTLAAYDGFVIATRAQVWEYMGGSSTGLKLGPYMDLISGNYSLTFSNFAAAAAAGNHAILHTSSRVSNAVINVSGYTSDGPSIGRAYVTEFALIGPAPFQGLLTNVYSDLASSVNTDIGTWLYRPTTVVIPEPSTFTMLAFCGIAMVGYTRLRRRRK
jgi:hypothetical protein